MTRYLAAALLVATAASADPTRTDPTPEITVFADGPNVVTLVNNPRSLAIRQPLVEAMNIKENGKPHMHNLGNSVVGLGWKSYWTRTRVIDGQVVCEKFARRPDTDAEVEEAAKRLLAAPCD